MVVRHYPEITESGMQNNNLNTIFILFVLIKTIFTLVKKIPLFISDLKKIYSSKVLDPNLGPQQLQDKVQFDIRFYFVRRANENIDKFT